MSILDRTISLERAANIEMAMEFIKFAIRELDQDRRDANGGVYARDLVQARIYANSAATRLQKYLDNHTVQTEVTE